MSVMGSYLLVLVVFLATLAIQSWLRSTYAHWSQVANESGLTGHK